MCSLSQTELSHSPASPSCSLPHEKRTLTTGRERCPCPFNQPSWRWRGPSNPRSVELLMASIENERGRSGARRRLRTTFRGLLGAALLSALPEANLHAEPAETDAP